MVGPATLREEGPVRTPRLLLLTAACSLLLVVAPSGAYDDDDDRDDRRNPRERLEPLAHRIAGAASLLYGVERNRATERFHESTHHFEDILDDRRERRIDDDWRAVREAYDEVRRRGVRRDAQTEFILTHLAEDMERGDRVVAHVESGGGGGYPGGGEEAGRLALIDRETCVGWNRVGPRPCPSARDSVTFSIPRSVKVLRQVNAEWRDFGRGANAEVYVNDRLVWRTDVAKDWDPDGKRLDMRIWPGSTITLRSGNGDPIWIRRLDIEAARDEGRF